MPSPTGARYVVVPYADRMELAYAAADLVVGPLGCQHRLRADRGGPARGLRAAAGRQRRAAAQRRRRRRGRRGLLVDDADFTPAWIDAHLLALAGRRRPGRRDGAGAPELGERGRRAARRHGRRRRAAERASCRGTPSVEQPFAAARFDFAAPVPDAAEARARAFPRRSAAPGMSGVARIMLAPAACRSPGSDAKDVPVLRALEAEGASVWVGFHEAHQERRRRRRHQLVDPRRQRRARRGPRARRPRAAPGAGARLAHGRPARRSPSPAPTARRRRPRCSTVALQGCGLDPSFAVGGELAKHGTNAHDGADDIFVVEADESDGSFVVYRPEVAIVTNVQPDHLDFYLNFKVVEAAYDAFVEHDPTRWRCSSRAPTTPAPWASPTARPGPRHPGRHLRLRRRRPTSSLGDHGADGLTSSVASTDGGRRPRPCRLACPGAHNALNAAAAYAAAVHGLGQRPECILAGLASFTGTRRRFEPKGEEGGVVVVDDYAHNAGKVAAVVETAKALVGDTGRLLVVFQPHLYSRTRDFATELGAGLAPADEVVVMDVYAAREDPVPGGVRAARRRRRAPARPEAGVHYVPSWSEVAAVVAALARPGDLVLTVGAGDVTWSAPRC